MLKVDRTKIDPQERAAAEGMEAMFLDYLMKTMRETVPKNDMDMESPATDIYRGMLDSENVQKVAQSGGVGLADQIIAYMEAERYTQNTPEERLGKPSQAGSGSANGTVRDALHGGKS